MDAKRFFNIISWSVTLKDTLTAKNRVVPPWSYSGETEIRDLRIKRGQRGTLPELDNCKLDTKETDSAHYSTTTRTPSNRQQIYGYTTSKILL